MAGGGSTSTKVEIPEWMENAAKDNLGRGNQISTLGFQPNYADRFAAFSPMQNDAFANTNAAANAFGMQSSLGNGMPAPTTFSDGSQGYSSIPLFDSAVADFRAARPGQAAAYDAMFIDPYTGAASTFNPVDNSGVASDTDTTAAIQEVAATLANNSNSQSQSVFDKSGLNGNTTNYDKFVGQHAGSGLNGNTTNYDKFVGQHAGSGLNGTTATFGSIPKSGSAQLDALLAELNANGTVKGNATLGDGFIVDSGVYTDPVTGEVLPRDTVLGLNANPDPELTAAYNAAVDAIPDPSTEIFLAQDMLANNPSGKGYNNAFQDVYDYQYNLSQNSSKDNPGMMTGTMITPEMLDANGVNAYLPPTSDGVTSYIDPITGEKVLSGIDPNANIIANNIANSIFTMGGLLGGGTPAPLPTSDGNDRAQQNIMALQNQFDTQDIIDSGVIVSGSSQAAGEFFAAHGDLTTTEAAEAATISQVALPSDGKAIRTALENAKADGSLGKYADSFATKSGTLMSERYQEKTGISPGLLADMQKIVKAKGAA